MGRLGRTAAAMGIGALSLTVGCGNFWVYPGSNGNGSGSSSGDYVYVANGTTATLAGFSVGTGTLTAVSGSPYALAFVPTAVAVNPANTIVFVAGTNLGNGYIDAFSIASNGSLTLLADNTVGLADVVSMDVSPDGQWLMGLDANGLTLDEYQISSNGQLTLATGAAYTVSGGAGTVVPRALKFSPNGDYVFAALGTAGDLVFPFNTSNGVLTTPPLKLTLTSSSGNSDNALTVDSSSSYLYVARSGTGGGLAIYTIGSGGALNEVGTPLTSGTQPTSVIVNKAGSDIYVANQLSGTIAEYSLASNGAVAALSPATISTVSQPWALAVDNSGNYLLAVSKVGSPDLAMYSYSSGQLAFSASTAAGTDPAGSLAVATTH